MKENNKLIRNGSIFGIIGNIFLFIIKIIIGVISKSQAMIADSINSATDIFASFMTYIGNRISAHPNDTDHNFGHGKAEYIFTMLISISMIIIAFKLGFDSVYNIINGNKLIFSWKLIIIFIVTIIVRLLLFFYTKYIYKKTDSILIKSNMMDHRNDMIITLFTTISILFTKLDIYFLDGITGLLISIWILITGIKLYRESYDVLMDKALDDESTKIILSIIKKYHNIKKIGNIYSIPIGYKYVVIITLLVNGKMTTIKSHEIADNIEKEIKDNIIKIEDVIVHIEPFSK